MAASVATGNNIGIELTQISNRNLSKERLFGSESSLTGEMGLLTPTGRDNRKSSDELRNPLPDSPFLDPIIDSINHPEENVDSESSMSSDLSDAPGASRESSPRRKRVGFRAKTRVKFEDGRETSEELIDRDSSPDSSYGSLDEFASPRSSIDSDRGAFYDIPDKSPGKDIRPNLRSLFYTSGDLLKMSDYDPLKREWSYTQSPQFDSFEKAFGYVKWFKNQVYQRERQFLGIQNTLVIVDGSAGSYQYPNGGIYLKPLFQYGVKFNDVHLRWSSFIRIEGKLVFLGLFANSATAAHTYNLVVDYLYRHDMGHRFDLEIDDMVKIHGRYFRPFNELTRRQLLAVDIMEIRQLFPSAIKAVLTSTATN